MPELVPCTASVISCAAFQPVDPLGPLLSTALAADGHQPDGIQFPLDVRLPA